MYTHSSDQAAEGAMALFKDQKQVAEYHEGYRLQTEKWPVNPLDVIIKQIVNKGAKF